MCNDELFDDLYIDMPEPFDNPIRNHDMLNRKNRDTITKFLGDGPRSVEAYSTEEYFGELLAWTVKRITTFPGWKMVSVLAYMDTKPLYRDVQTDYTITESCLANGQMLMEQGDTRLVITIAAGAGCVQIEAKEENQELVNKLVKDIADFLNKNNFYRGKHISFNRKISFLKAGQCDWKSVILDSKMKQEIRRNTIGFLKNRARLESLGLPIKRGIILAGEPGTGKTMICKALFSEAEEITCITTTAYGMLRGDYISDLFAIAQDLSPSMVFIEDLDCIGKERDDIYRGTPLLIALLAEMDGITEKTAVVTVATTNSFETLDKALSARPQRFDRAFKIACPNPQQRTELVEHISEKIPLSEDIRVYIVKETNGFTPAQIQEVLYSMVISNDGLREETMQFTRSDVDSAIAWLNIRKNGTIGFNGIPIDSRT